METKNTLISIEPDLANFCHDAWEINDYLIECVFTIMGSTRVCIREKGSQVYSTNWCAGDNVDHIIKLVNAAIEVIDEDLIDGVMFCSRVKPYFKDPEFTMWIDQYKKRYVEKLRHYSFAKALIFKSC